MTTVQNSRPKRGFANSRRVRLSTVLFFLISGGTVCAQNDAVTPLAVAPGRPNGSYAVSDIDTVNLFNGHVNVNLPLITLSGRGGAKSQLSMSWDAPARYQVFSYLDVNGNPAYYVGPPNYWTDVNLHDGGIGIRVVGTGVGGPNHCEAGAFGYNFYIWNTTLTRMYLVDPDGTEHEMRDVTTGGQALPFTGNCWSTTGPSRGRIFVSTDGSGATYIADTDIRDGFVVDNEWPTGGGGWLLLKDGTRVHIGGGTIRDRNGNMFWPYKDSLNRTVDGGIDSGTQCSTNAPGSSFCQWYAHKGFGGAERRIWIGYDGSPGPSGIFLPNGRSYKFYYNQYNDLSRVDLPTGGSIEYDYEPGLTGPQSPCQIQGCIPGTYSTFVYRRVVERRVYKEGHALESRQTFSRPEDVYGNNQGFVERKHYDSAGHVLV